MSHCSGKIGALVLVLMLITGIMYSQGFSFREKQLWLKADKMLDQDDYLQSKKLYEQLYAIDSTNQEINFKLGLCCFELKPYRENSEKYFNKVSSANNAEVDYYLGRLYHLHREYDRALLAFNRYRTSRGEHEHGSTEISNLVAKCYTAKLMEAKADRSLQIENMGSTINSPYAEYCPLIPADERFLLFTSRRKNPVHILKDPMGEYFEDIYISWKKDGNWQTPHPLDTVVNTPLHDACTGLSADGQKMLIYRTSKNLTGGDIYQSILTDSSWSRPAMLETEMNSPGYLETSACFSPDAETIFFSSNKPGGYGGKDLYMLRKLPNGKWGRPFNLGPEINTEFDEDAPFIHPSGNILFFSSQGHTNMGGYDIFKSTFDETGHFSTPENMGYPLNTSDDDIFFVLNTDASVGYFSSDREGGFGSQDIYSVKFTEACIPLNVFSVFALDESNNVVKKAELFITDMDTHKIYGDYKGNEQTGKLTVIIQPNKEYQISIRAAGYKPFTTTAIFGPNSSLSFILATSQSQ